VTGNVFFDVTSENILNLLLLKSTFDDQLIVTINGAARTQLREEEIQQVLLRSMKPEIQLEL